MNPKSPKTNDHKEGFFGMTLGRKKKKEIAEYENELRVALDGEEIQPEYLLQSFQLDENEERSMIEKNSLKNPNVLELQKVLKDWINNSLVDQRIIVKDLQEDLFDGQVLQKLLETIAKIKLEVPEVTQTSLGQKGKLQAVLEKVHENLKLKPTQAKWSVDSIHSKNLVAILHLLVELAKHYHAPIRMPENVLIKTIVVTKKDGKLIHKTVNEVITTTLEEMTGGRFARDAFDTLLDHAPDKLSIVKKSLIDFANNHLEILSLSVYDLDTQFSDGINLILLMGLLENYFVPTHMYSLTPATFDEKVKNVELAFELMKDANILLPKTQPQDIAKCELKSTLRVLYNLFNKYKVKRNVLTM